MLMLATDVDLEREKLKLKDLLDMGFIHEDEYRQRFADLTGSAPPTATGSSTTPAIFM